MISIKYIYKYYGNHAAIDFVSEKMWLEILEGEVIGILGANGAGKTTLLKAICNLITVDGGQILVDNEVVKGEVYNKLSYITEEGSFFSYLTPAQHEEFFEANYEKFNKERFNKLLDYFKIDKNKKLSQFSKGQKAKFEVVSGFCKGAKYILMDEPFLGNDVFTRRDFLKLMIGTLKSDETIVIATHLVEEIDNLLSRAVLLEEGKVKEVVTMEELKDSGKNLTDIMRALTKYNENKILDLID
jgi:ABC-2 type transport system ATP-binding protein